ncbi:MAG: hypothetical protein HY544_00450 [Candidatus Diapherotrites archaeon]|uniref:Uncharacterized protein n=1 Tax=Candidatus Iainarchaeum sp. TaxID=3101447 RepID=A0A8T3YJH7_9ARCH|nr:hypothetical protein [Candidatus Diapherotrites archaeon]
MAKSGTDADEGEKALDAAVAEEEEEVLVDNEDRREDAAIGSELFGTSEEQEKKDAEMLRRPVKNDRLLFNILALAAIIALAYAIYWAVKKGVVKF